MAFRVDGTRSDDVGFALSSSGFYVRTGRHCLLAASLYDDAVRVSVHMYNSEAELSRFAAFLALVTQGAG